MFDFSIFFIHMSNESSFSSIKASKESVVLKMLLMDPIKKEKKVRPMNSRAIEKIYSSLVAPE